MAGVCSGPGPCDTSPLGTSTKPWIAKVGGLPLYIRAIAQALQRKGHSESSAIATAVATVKRWAAGGGNVSAETRARAAAAVAEWESKKAASHSLTAAPTPAIDLAWDEAKHPRKGGKFAPKGTQSQPAAQNQQPTTAQINPALAAQIRDFQKRMGLPVTGNFDQATVAKIQAVRTAKGGGGGKGKGGKGGASKAAAAAKKQQAATAKYLKATAAARAKAAKQAAAKQKAAATLAARQGKSKAAATANAVNALTPAQRAAYRAKNPAPAGYAWTAKGTLAAVSTVAAQKQVAARIGG
jgi:hypothetical protein